MMTNDRIWHKIQHVDIFSLYQFYEGGLKENNAKHTRSRNNTYKINIQKDRQSPFVDLCYISTTTTTTTGVTVVKVNYVMPFVSANIFHLILF